YAGLRWSAAQYAGLRWSTAQYADLRWSAAQYAGLWWSAAQYAGLRWSAAQYAGLREGIAGSVAAQYANSEGQSRSALAGEWCRSPCSSRVYTAVLVTRSLAAWCRRSSRWGSGIGGSLCGAGDVAVGKRDSAVLPRPALASRVAVAQDARDFVTSPPPPVRLCDVQGLKNKGHLGRVTVRLLHDISEIKHNYL
ncbi:hypothetical protein X777_11118, partial [Ooceraea biroi]